MNSIEYSIYVEKVIHKLVVKFNYRDMVNVKGDYEKFIKSMIISIIYDLELGISVLSNESIPYIDIAYFKQRDIYSDSDNLKVYNEMVTNIYKYISDIKTTNILQLVDITIIDNKIILTIAEMMHG